MRKEYEAFIAAIESATSSHVEYVTEHTDSGDNYSDCLPDEYAHNNGSQRFAEFLSSHGIATEHAEGIEADIIDSFDSIEMVTGSIFGPSGAPSFYATGDDNHHAGPPRRFVVGSFLIEEVEDQQPLEMLSDSPFVEAFAAKAVEDNRVCVRYSEGDDSLLSYEATDAAWFAVVELADVLDCLETILENA